MIVANLFAVIAIALGCAGARPPLSRHRFGFPASLGLALLALAVVEQINFAPTAQLSRAFDIARLQHVQAAPSSCRSFYVSDERNWQPYEVQIDAMLVALGRERPAINGYSGLFPPGWGLFDTKDAAYEQHVAAWIASRKLEGVCRVDVEAGTWTSSQMRTKSFANTSDGWHHLLDWLVALKIRRVHACLELTGRYSLGIACALYEAGHIVSIINPAQVRDFVRTKLGRNKTDGIDASRIREYCELFKPLPWAPPSEAHRRLGEL